MKSTNFITIVIAFIFLKLNYFPQFSWVFVFSPLLTWLVLKGLRLVSKVFLTGLVVGIVKAFKK